MKLLENKTIYLVAPSFGCTTSPYKERLLLAIKNLEKLGYKIIKGKNIFLSKQKNASNTAENRADEIIDAFNSEASLILSVGGGEMECEILPYIDFKLLSKSKKVFMGFSDNTNTAFSLATISNIKSIYGLCAPSFFKIGELEKTVLNLLENNTSQIKGFNKYFNYHTKKKYLLEKEPFTIKKEIISINSFKEEKGILLGGCLDCLINICGTKFDNVVKFSSSKKEGIIFYFESCDLNPLQVERALLQLKNASWFNNTKAFLFGRMQDINYTEKRLNYTYKEAIIKALEDYQKPILLDIDLGHIPPSLPFINNALTNVEYKNNNIIITYLD